MKALWLCAVVAFVQLVSCFSAQASDPHSAYYGYDNDRVFWFVQISDIHIGAKGTQDENYLTWIVNEAKSVIEPEFIVATGDLTDSTNGNFFGIPNGPYQAEWDQYKAILANKVDAGNYYDIPGNHEAYNDQYFQYYQANSVQGQATGQTQISWSRAFPFGTYHFLGVNSADNSGDPFRLASPWGDFAGLDSSELAFINNELALHQDAELTMVFGHHPVTSTGDSQDTYLYYGASEFITYLDTYGTSFYGYGHTHRSEEDLFAGDNYTGYMTGDGVFYLNVPSLGKSGDWHYSVVAIDCNGVSSVTEAKGSWPVVLVTAPVDKFLGSAPNPYSYSVLNALNPIRALVFDVNAISSVRFRINGAGDWYPMTLARPEANPHLWEGVWDASALPTGDCTIEVQAESYSGTKTNLITVAVEAGSGCDTKFYRDSDGDGFGDSSSFLLACTAPSGYVADSSDCNDGDAAIHPGAFEVCDDKDNDCDGQIDEGLNGTMFYRDIDSDGYGDPANHLEACAAPSGYVVDGTDCNDGDATIYTGAVEICDGKDNDCDGQIDEGLNSTIFYRDMDSDGYGNPVNILEACAAPSGYVADNSDCNDTNASIHPGAKEICNQKDDDCDGILDENCVHRSMVPYLLLLDG